MPAPTADEGLLSPISHDGLLVSEADYWQHSYLGQELVYEWNNGRLEEKPLSDYGTFLVYEWLLALLGRFLRACPIARGVALDMGFRMALPDGVRIRRPDYGVVRNHNPLRLLPLDASYHGIYDLCIEALSDQKRTDQERDQVTKKTEYEAGGIAEYWSCIRGRTTSPSGAAARMATTSPSPRWTGCLTPRCCRVSASG